VRVMFDEYGQEVATATPGKPVELLGLPKVPDVGTVVYRKDQEALERLPQQQIEISPKPGALETPQPEEIAVQKLKIVLKTDNVGSLEAILESVKNKTNVTIIASGTGSISESDVILAKSSGAIIIGFQVKPPSSVVKLAQSEKVMMKIYSIIYEMLSEIDEVAEALQSGGLEEVLGEGRIIAIFEMKKDKIAGIKVISGRIAKGDKVKIMREEKEIGRTRIKSLRHGKEDITKAEQGVEAGVSFSSKLDFLINDSIIAIG
jgi:translation initiation factor IF-2